MNPKIKGIVLLIIVLLVGLVIGWFSSNFLWATTSGHQPIADLLRLEQPDVGYTLKLKCVGSGYIEFGELSLQPLNFVEGETYLLSTWVCTRHGDTEAVVTITGPGEDGVTYHIEVARLGLWAIDVYFAGELKVHFDEIAEPGSGQVGLGYAGFVVNIQMS